MDFSKNPPQEPDNQPPVPPAGPDYNQQYGYPQQNQSYPSQINPGYPAQPPYNAYGNQPMPPGYPVPQFPNSQAPNSYGPPQYYGPPQGYQQPYGYPPAISEGQKLAKESWIYGLVGFFILGVVLGGVGLYKAFKAKALGADATVGFVLSSLAIVGHIFWFIVFITLGDTPTTHY